MDDISSCRAFYGSRREIVAALQEQNDPCVLALDRLIEANGLLWFSTASKDFAKSLNTLCQHLNSFAAMIRGAE